MAAANKVLYWPKLFEGAVHPVGVQGNSLSYGDGPVGTTTGWDDPNGGDSYPPSWYGTGKGCMYLVGSGSWADTGAGPNYGGR
jgi:hypothetical protein